MEDRSLPPLYQVKVALRGISPLIWRRFLISSQETLAELHRVIQVAFGWMDLHLHRFEIHGREYGLYRPGGLGFDESARRVPLASLDLREGEKFLYTYDFIDHWAHEVRLEELLPAGSGQQAYPICTAGSGRGPLEDCGGPWEYQKLIALHRRGPLGDYLRLCLRLGELFDPSAFDRQEVNEKLQSGYWPEEIIRIAHPDDPLEKLLRRLLGVLDPDARELWEEDDF